VLLNEPMEDPRDRVPLLSRRIQVRPQHLVDHELVRIESSSARRELLPWFRPGGVHRLPHRPVRHPVLALQGSHRHPSTVVTPDRRIQLNLRHLLTSTFHQEHPDAALARTAVLSKLVNITRPWIGMPPKPINNRCRYP